MSWSASSFPMRPLGELVRIQAGYAFESARFTDVPTDLPLVKGENVQQGYVDWSIAKRWPEAEADSLEQFLLWPGDIVVAMDRPWVEAGLKWAYIKPEDPPSLLVQRVARLRAGSELDQTYLRAVISSSYFSAYIQPIVTGVNVPHISGKQIAAFKVPVPSMAVQRKVAALICSYDDLIANNQRRIALLESMAEEIYCEWFVRMRFPGASAVERKKGIPSGWRVCSIADLYTTSSGGTPSRSNPANFSGTIPWVKTGELKQTFISATEECISETGLESSAAKLLPARTIVMAMYCAMPDVAILDVAAATNQACCALTPKSRRLGFTWSYFFARNALREMVNFAHGAAQQNLSQEIIRKFKVLAPDEAVVEQFEAIANPFFEEVALLYRQNAVLRATRDALLPRLISGKLRVDALDIKFPPSMQPPPEETAQATSIKQGLVHSGA